ncbi:MAG TPA: T9SS type A sorting domain-containing protein [Candidatus Paceibacterota bacterium]|nr:T9SS type A sorting domain-containing protein [Candidatus Paceibacterota bacterium]
MKKLLLTLAMSLIIATVSAQEFSCASDLAEQSAMANYPNYARDRQSSLLFADHYRNSFSARMLNIGCQKTAIKYRIPIVFHVVHLGEVIGTGTNIPDTQINNSLTRMNQYMAQLGVEFVPAQQDQYGNPIINGVDRVNGSSVPNYATFGIDIRLNPVGAPDTTIKRLKRLPYQFCVNVWIVNKIATGSPYSNMPSGYEFQGIVITGPGISARSTLSHEVGHYMGLYHTFHGSSGSNCAPNDDPSHQGDFCTDTPPLLQSDCGGSSSCGIFGNIINSWKNIMGYCAGGNLFTPDQKLLVMAALFGEFRWGLVQSAALNSINVPLEVSLDSIAFVQNTILPICNGNLTTIVQFGNYSSNSIDSIKIHFKLGSLDTIFTRSTAGGFLRGLNNWLTMPTVRFAASGNYTAEVEFLKINGLDDYNPMNNNQCISVDVVVQTITISTGVNITGAGTLSGSGNFSCNGVVDTLRAIANTGYVFQSITEGSAVVSTNPTFPLPIDLSRGNRVFIANFVLKTFSINVAANGVGGSVSGGGSSISYGSSATVTATEFGCYTFTGWYENGVLVFSNKTYTFTVTNARNLEARFVQKQFVIAAASSNDALGTVSGGDTYGCGSTATVRAHTKTGGKFLNWTDNNTGQVVFTDSVYNFQVTGGRLLIANFVSVVTGIVNNTSDIDFLIFPNPTSHVLNIEFGSVGTCNAEMYNMVGDMLWSESLTKQKTVDVTGFAKGVYILKLDDGNTITSKQFIVQ